MFRNDTDLLGELAEILPIEEIEEKFGTSDGNLNIMKIAVFLIKRNLASKVLEIMLEEKRKPRLTDIPKAIAFYRKELKAFESLLGQTNEE